MEVCLLKDKQKKPPNILIWTQKHTEKNQVKITKEDQSFKPA